MYSNGIIGRNHHGSLLRALSDKHLNYGGFAFQGMPCVVDAEQLLDEDFLTLAYNASKDTKELVLLDTSTYSERFRSFEGAFLNFINLLNIKVFLIQVEGGADPFFEKCINADTKLISGNQRNHFAIVTDVPTLLEKADFHGLSSIRGYGDVFIMRAKDIRVRKSADITPDDIVHFDKVEDFIKYKAASVKTLVMTDKEKEDVLRNILLK